MKKLFIFFIALITFQSYGVFLKDIPVALFQPDGKKIDCYITGDEYFNYLHDAEGYTLIKGNGGWYYYGVLSGDEVTASSFKAGEDDPVKAGISKGAVIPEKSYKQIASSGIDIEGKSSSSTPKSGIINKLAVFIRFADETDSVFSPQRSYYDQFFSKAEGPSLKHYYKEVSYNLLDISTTYYPNVENLSENASFQDIYPRSYYEPYSETENPGGYTDLDDRVEREHALLERAVMAVSDEIPEYLDLDTKPDGNVDDVTFLVSGNVGEWANILWPHKGTLYTRDIYINGKKVYDYNFLMTGSEAYFNVGVLAHEFFHLLGAPDLYHYTNWTISEPIGPWDLMAQTADPPQHMSAWMKYKYGGWLTTLPVIILPRQYTLYPVTSPSGNIFKIKSPYSADEFFIVEYRKQEGIYESSLPGTGDGLLIYRIISTCKGNSYGPPDEIYVYRPDGSLTEHGIIEDAQFCVQLNRTEFYEWTNPYPYLSSGDYGGINIFEVGEAGDTINFTVSFDSDSNDCYETFDSGNFSAREWYFEGNAEWTIDNGVSYIGSSARSGPITHNQTTSMCLDVNFKTDGEVSFYRKVSSQAGYDLLKFMVDGTLMGSWSGSRDWENFLYQVSAGVHKLEWKYTKNLSVSTGSDCGWIDNIYLYGVFELIYPDGGEVFSKGGQYEISCLDMSGENVKYELYKSDIYLMTISESTPSGTACLWTVPNDLDGSDFKIKAISVEYPEISDISVSSFSIITGGIKVISPPVSEIIEMLDDYTIEWLDGFNEDVKISLLKANETVHSFTAPSEKNYIWDFYYDSIVSGTDYKIRVESVLDSTVFHESGVFSIIGTNGISGPAEGSWTDSYSPYIITDSTYVESGSVLTVSPGVKVKGSDEKNPLNIFGKLEVSGTNASPVLFRDCNLYFSNSACADSSKLIYAVFDRTASSAKERSLKNSSIIVTDNSKVVFQNCVIRNSNSFGVTAEDSDPVISGCLITNNAGGIKFINSSATYITNNTISRNTSEGIHLTSGSNPMFLNNIICGNTGYEVYINDDISDPEFYYNDIIGGKSGFGLNTGVSFIGAYIENINADPVYISGGFQISDISPCKDNGYPGLNSEVLGYLYIPVKDLYGNNRLRGDIDIGVSEYNTLTVPLSPSDVAISVAQDSIRISWNGSENAEYYKIYSSVLPDTGYILEGTVSNTVWYEPSGSIPVKFYYVSACNDSKEGESESQNVKKIKVQKIEDMLRRR